ncbi:MAG: hypothetical protein ACRDJO_06635 [Actinomycetota bacterium]
MKPSVRGAGRREAACVSLVAAASLLVAVPAPAHADVPGGTNAFCHIDVPQVTVAPGFSSVPVQGTGASGEGATIRCVGTIDGHQVLADPGPLSVTFDYGTGPLSSVTQGDTCLIGSGDGVVNATVTAVDGTTIELTGPVHFSFIGPLATFYGHFGTRAYAGLGEPIPDLSTIQDCLGTPITKFSIRGQIALKDV